MTESNTQSDRMTEEERGAGVNDVHGRRETMADGKRYIIYYTFGNRETNNSETEAIAENV